MKNLDCLLVAYTGNNLEHEKDRIKEVYNKQVHLETPFNLAIAYLGTQLDKLGISFRYILSFDNSQAELLEIMNSYQISTIAISTTFCPSAECIQNIVSFIRNVNTKPKIILGGYYIAARMKQLSEPERLIFARRFGADFYVNSFYGESTLGEIILTLQSGRDINKIKNIYYKEFNTYRATESETELYPINRYNINWNLFENQLGVYVPIRTSISCPYRCNYCSYPQNAGAYQQLDISQIEEELTQLKNIGKTKIIHFIADTFNVPKDHFKKILEMLIRNRFGFKWHSFFRCQYADDEIVEMMKESGCQGVHIGFESGNQGMLDRMNKAVTVEDYFRGHSILKKFGIITTGLFFIGFPGETLGTVKDTVKFINSIQPDYYLLQPFLYDPSTPIRNFAQEYELKGIMYDWSHKTMNSEMAIKLVEQVPKIIRGSIKRNIDVDVSFFYQLLNSGLSINEIKEIEIQLNEFEYNRINFDKKLLTAVYEEC